MAGRKITLQKTISSLSNASQKQKTSEERVETQAATSRRTERTEAEYIIFCHRLCLYLDINPLDYLQKLKH